jgi:hypothetical protein
MVEGKLAKLKAGRAKRRKGDGRKPVYGPEMISSLRLIPAGRLVEAETLLAERAETAAAWHSGPVPFYPKLLEKRCRI